MKYPYPAAVPLLLLALAACGSAESAVPAVRLEPVPLPAPDTVVERPVEAPAPARPAPPVVSVEQSRAAPFAVRSAGRPAPRGERRVVLLPAEPSRAPAPVAAAGAAATPAPPADSARRAGAPPAPAPTTSAPTTSAPTTSAPPAAVAGTRTHRVEWGQTWYGIAREHGVTPRDLAAANPGVDPERLRSGEVLRIPRVTGRPGARRTHTIVAGETLWGVARRYGISAAELRRANRLQDDIVRTGQTLIIPQEEERR